MNWIIRAYPEIVTTIGVLDATLILGMGMVSAVMWLFDVKSDTFWERVWPATGVLVGTSVGAGIVFTITRYIAAWALTLN